MTKKEIIELKSKVIELGKQGFGAADIEHKGICSRQTANKYLKAAGIYIDKRGGQNAKIDYNPFISRTPEGDYWLGMLLADGWINTRKHGIGLKQGGHNKTHMLKYHKFLQYKPNLYESADKRHYTIIFGHRPTSDWLIKIGIIPQKSLKLQLNIPFNWDIVRGYFDGDGGFNISNGRYGTYVNAKFTSGSIKILQQLQTFLLEAGIASRLYSELPTVFRLSISGKSRYIFCKKMYTDASIYMERKKKIWDKYAQEKQGELLETPEEDNQQPSLSSNTLEGSETNSRIQASYIMDSNTDTSALHYENNDNIVQSIHITK